MTVLQKTLHNSLVFYDSVHTHRWYDAIGPQVRKWLFVDEYPLDSSTATAVNASTITGLASSLGGGWVFTTAAAGNDAIQVQANSEMAYFGGPYPAYFGIRLSVATNDNHVLFAGCAITDTTICAACSDNIGFHMDDNDASIFFIAENTNVETTVELAELVAATPVTLEFYYDGVTTVTYYVNGVEAGSIETSIANMPDDEHLAPAIALLTGAGGATVMTVYWARFIQILE
jgi:hypothetical protein